MRDIDIRVSSIYVIIQGIYFNISLLFTVQNRHLFSMLWFVYIVIYFWAMAKNGSSRCFFDQKRMYLKTIAAESVVGCI